MEEKNSIKNEEEDEVETKPKSLLKWFSQFSFAGRALLTMYSVYGVVILFGWDMQYLVFISTTNYASKIVGSLYILLYTFYGVVVSNVIIIPLWDFFKFPFLRKSNCFNSITYLIGKILGKNEKYEKTASREIYNIDANDNVYTLVLNCSITIFSIIWFFLIGYAYAGFAYTPFDYCNSIMLALSLTYYLVLQGLYEIYFMVKLFKLIFIKKNSSVSVDTLKTDDLLPNEKKENEEISNDVSNYTKQDSNDSIYEGEIDNNDPFLRAFDQTYAKIVGLINNWHIDGLKKLTHDIVIFVNVFIIQIISFTVLIYSLICQSSNIRWYTWIVSLFFFSLFFIPSFTLRFPSWLVRTLFRCCVPKPQRKDLKEFTIFPLLSAFVYCLIILVELILFVLFVFVAEEDYSQIHWEPPEKKEFTKSSRDYIKPTFCFTTVHNVSILQLMAFANDAYYNEGNKRDIEYLRYSFFNNSDFEIIAKGNMTGFNETGATMIRYDLNIPNSQKNVTILSIRGTSTNVDWWLDFQLFYTRASFTITKNAVPILTKSDSQTYQFASFLFSLPTRAFIELSLIDKYVNTLQKAYLDSLSEYEDRSIIFVGHSLGGGLAKIMGKLFMKESVSLSGPGISIFNHLWNPNITNYNENFPISFIDIVPDMDLVPRVEVSGGTYYRIICDAGSGQCHSALRSLCMGAIMCHEDAEYVCRKSFNFTEDDLNHMKEISNINGEE